MGTKKLLSLLLALLLALACLSPALADGTETAAPLAGDCTLSADYNLAILGQEFTLRFDLALTVGDKAAPGMRTLAVNGVTVTKVSGGWLPVEREAASFHLCGISENGQTATIKVTYLMSVGSGYAPYDVLITIDLADGSAAFTTPDALPQPLRVPLSLREMLLSPAPSVF